MKMIFILSSLSKEFGSDIEQELQVSGSDGIPPEQVQGIVNSKQVLEDFCSLSRDSDAANSEPGQHQDMACGSSVCTSNSSDCRSEAQEPPAKPKLVAVWGQDMLKSLMTTQGIVQGLVQSVEALNSEELAMVWYASFEVTQKILHSALKKVCNVKKHRWVVDSLKDPMEKTMKHLFPDEAKSSTQQEWYNSTRMAVVFDVLIRIVEEGKADFPECVGEIGSFVVEWMRKSGIEILGHLWEHNQQDGQRATEEVLVNCTRDSVVGLCQQWVKICELRQSRNAQGHSFSEVSNAQVFRKACDLLAASRLIGFTKDFMDVSVICQAVASAGLPQKEAQDAKKQAGISIDKKRWAIREEMKNKASMIEASKPLSLVQEEVVVIPEMCSNKLHDDSLGHPEAQAPQKDFLMESIMDDQSIPDVG